MTQEDVFGIIVRAIGLIALLYSGVFLNFALAFNGELGLGLMPFVVYAAIGIYLLRGARHIVNFSYPKRAA